MFKAEVGLFPIGSSGALLSLKSNFHVLQQVSLFSFKRVPDFKAKNAIPPLFEKHFNINPIIINLLGNKPLLLKQATTVAISFSKTDALFVLNRLSQIN